MKLGLGVFWGLYMLFFAIPFPMFMYYSIKSDDPPQLAETNPWLALGALALSVILWGILLGGYFRKWIISNFIGKRNIDYLNRNGVPRKAEITEAVKISKDGSKCDTYELKLLFKNLVDTEIIQKASVNDAKPQQRRFEIGKKVDIRIDKEMKKTPYFIFAGTEATINIPVIFLICLGWLALTALVLGYYVYAYQTENAGMGWRFIFFWHPLFVCPAVLLFYRGGLSLLLSKFAGGKEGDAELIKFKGIKTQAKLISANQTGTYINEQPMVLFKLEYTDHQNRTRRAEIKKIVDLLELNSVQQKTVDIFYLKENPDRIAFAADLEKIS